MKIESSSNNGLARRRLSRSVKPCLLCRVGWWLLDTGVAVATCPLQVDPDLPVSRWPDAGLQMFTVGTTGERPAAVTLRGVSGWARATESVASRPAEFDGADSKQLCSLTPWPAPILQVLQAAPV